MAVIQGVLSGTGQDVDANNQALVRPAILPANTGYVGLVSRSEAGVSGSVRARPILGTIQNRLMNGETTPLWYDLFNYTSQNTATYKFLATTMTAAQIPGSGTLNLNSGSSVATNVNCAVQTTRVFPLLCNSELRAIMQGQFPTAADHVANTTVEFGLLTASLPGGAAPTDGVFFRYNTAAELRGVMNFNGLETQTVAITRPSVNVMHEYMIIVTEKFVEFWIDQEFRAAISLLTDAPAQQQPCLQASLPFTVRQYTGVSAPATATRLQVGGICVLGVGAKYNRPISIFNAGMGLMAYQGQNGGSIGTTAQYANNTNPAPAVPTNTTAALGTGLGGKFQETLTLAAGTDGIIQSFQVPAGSTTQTPRNLVITGISVQGVVTVALTTNPLSGTLALNFGHTAVSLATAESGSFVSGGAKAPRRIAIGTTSVASATAAAGTPVIGGCALKFDTPIVVAPGEFVAVSHNKVSAAPATGAIMWTVTYDAYYE